MHARIERRIGETWSPSRFHCGGHVMDSFSHILLQTRQNIEFLIAQNQIPQNDGREILEKLPPTATVVSSGPAFKARALWGYNEQGQVCPYRSFSGTLLLPSPYTQDPNDLSFQPGDLIDVIAETNPDWWTGTHRGRRGLFPSNYVERLHPPVYVAPIPPVPTPYAPPSHSGPDKPPFQPTPSSYPYQPAGGYQPPLPGGAYNPYSGPAQPQPPQVVANPEQPPKKGKFGGKFGSTVCLNVYVRSGSIRLIFFPPILQLAHSAVGGVGFGAGGYLSFLRWSLVTFPSKGLLWAAESSTLSSRRDPTAWTTRQNVL